MIYISWYGMNGDHYNIIVPPLCILVIKGLQRKRMGKNYLIITIYTNSFELSFVGLNRHLFSKNLCKIFN
jgi:hypothetical protein